MPESALSPSAEPFQKLCEELRRLVESGVDISIESFVSERSEQSIRRETVVELIVTLFSLRREKGENPNPTQWLLRYAEYREALRERFRLLGVLEESGKPVTGYTAARSSPQGVAEELLELPAHEIVEELGRGGQAVVYRAYEKSLKRYVALKVMREGKWTTNAALKRFYREAEIAGQSVHSNLVPVYHLGMYKGEAAFTMPWYNGGTMKEVIERRPSWRESVGLMEKVAKGVGCLHRQGWVHRDLKPSNVLMSERGEPHVADFGLVRGPAEEILTRTGQMVGTVPYMSPEQTRGKKVEATSDVWSLGVMLYELLTGRRPFQGGSEIDLMMSIQQEKPVYPSVSESGRGIPGELDAVVMRCLEKRADKRYGDANELAEELGRVLRGEPVKTAVVVPRGPWWLGSRAAVGMLAAPLIAVALALVPETSRKTDPERAVLQYEKELEEHRPVMLIERNRGPRYHRWWIDEERQPFHVIRLAHTQLRSDRVTLMELMPEMPISSYRLRMVVEPRPRGANPNTFGLYLLGMIRGDDKQREYDVCRFSMTLDPRVKEDPIRWDFGAIHHVKHGRPNPTPWQVSPALPKNVIQPILNQGMIFSRTYCMEVNVTMNRIEAFIDNIKLGTWDRDKMERDPEVIRFLWENIFKHPPGPLKTVPTYPASGSLGLYLSNSDIVVKELQIIPQPNRR